MVDKITKRKKFVALANKRVTKALNEIRLIGNLSDKRYYEYSEMEVSQILTALSKELQNTKSRFKNSLNGKVEEFSLQQGFIVED